MFRSLHMKLVMILVLLVVSVMSVVGTFLINSVTSFYISEFNSQIATVFSEDFLKTLERTSKNDNGAVAINEVLAAYSGSLGIDSYRHFYILDSKTGEYLTGSNDALGKQLSKSQNIIAAMAGHVGDGGNAMEDYMDIAVPIGDDYLVYVKDTKQEIRDLTWILFTIIIQAMLFGLVIAIFLSFLLSKTMTNPIENLTKSAKLVANGQFDNALEVQSDDEIGILTQTFNDMAQIMKKNLVEIAGERDKLNALFLHMTDGVTAFTKNGKIIHMNLAAEQILNLRFSEDLTFKQVFDGVTIPKDEEAGKKGFVKCEIKRGDRSFDVFFAPFGTDTADGGLMAVIHDITEQKKLDNARREFVANVSHELRTPLTNIKGYAETILDGKDDLPDEILTRFLGVILSEADRMTRIVKDLLTLSKLDYGRMEVRFSPVPLRAVMEHVYEAMKLEAASQGHVLSLTPMRNLGLIFADQDRIEQVVINIVSNAIKYTTKDGNIKMQAERVGEKLQITVTDNGMGIPKEDLPRLFERFYRVDKARSRERGGTGLGLAIAKEIVEAHGGSITAESTMDVGTAITILLPVYDVKDETHEE